MEKEYNVILNKEVGYNQFGKDMVEITTKDGIPNREITVADERLGSYRQTHYYLTDEEAETVRLHPDVLAVEIPPADRDDIIIGHNGRQSNSFTKSPGTTQSHANYALLRSKYQNNVYGAGTELSEDYLYNLDGTGVDVVIQDSGIQADHPEWEDQNGVSRLKQINWGTESGLGFQFNSTNHYRDFHGHGTHVASTIAGKTFGWAKNANIYALKVAGLEGDGDTGTFGNPSTVPTQYAFDAIKLWHRNKPIDPKTGHKRPTIVNMSWGYLSTYNTVSSVNYRGTSTDVSALSRNQIQSNYGLVNFYSGQFSAYVTNVRITSIDTDVEEMIDEGILVCIAAGNRSHKVDTSTGDDYNNTATTNSGTKTYHRGSSPAHERAILVGSLDNNSYSSTQDQKATYSETGPGVDIWAHGTSIMAASSNTNAIGGYTYQLDGNYKQVAISGTSMAAPQVAGVAALLYQANPGATVDQIKQFLIDQGGDALYSTGNTVDYINTRSLQGAVNKVLYNKFGKKENCLEISGTFDIPLSITF
tara:strand:+ start:6097 stop:7689 length:1593 start_codon:yes stop_codon:yes gene_type:complete